MLILKSTKLIISININIQTEAPTQRRGIDLLANWSRTHAGRNLNVNIHADFSLYVNIDSNRELLLGIIPFAPWRTLTLHVKSVQNCWKHTFPPTYSVGSACLDCISHCWLITQKPPASDLLVSLQPFEFMFLFCFFWFFLFFTITVCQNEVQVCNGELKLLPLALKLLKYEFMRSLAV